MESRIMPIAPRGPAYALDQKKVRQQSGHEVVVDRDDFSIVKFNWPRP
jgi:hypothetical protein